MKLGSIFSVILLLSTAVSDLSAMHKPMQFEERKTPAQKKSGKYQRLSFGLEKFNFAKSLTGEFFVKAHLQHRPPTPPRKRPADQPSLETLQQQQADNNRSRKRKKEPDDKESGDNNPVNKKRKVAATPTAKKAHTAMQTEGDAKQERKQVNAAVQTDTPSRVTVSMDVKTSINALCQVPEERIESLLKVVDEFRVAPIHAQAAQGNIEFFTMLASIVQNSSYSITIIDVLNARDADKRTPLHHAVQKGHHELVECMLKYGSDVNAQDVNGLAALHMAAQNQDKKMIVLLVKHDARKDLLTNLDVLRDGYGKKIKGVNLKVGGQSPLHLLLSVPCTDINEEHEYALLKELIKCDVLRKPEDLFDNKSFEYQPNDVSVLNTWKYYADCCQLLLDNEINDITDASGRTPMVYALEHRSLAYMHVLNCKDAINWFHTSVYGRRPYIEYLETIKIPVQVDLLNEDDLEKLYENKDLTKFAALFCTFPVAASLDFQGYLADTQSSGKNILHALLQQDSVMFLLLEILDITAQEQQRADGLPIESFMHKALDDRGNTILHLTARYNARQCMHIHCYQNQVGAGVLQAKNNAAQTALDIAFENKHFKFAFALLFESLNDNIYEPFMSLTPEYINALMSILTPEHIDLLMGITDAQGNTPLHHLVSKKSKDLIRLVARNPEHFTKTNNAGKTPFDCACKFGANAHIFKECLKILGKNKPFFVVKTLKKIGYVEKYDMQELFATPLDDDGNTLMHYVMKRAEDVKELLELLKSIGIDIENGNSQDPDDSYYGLFEYEKNNDNEPALVCALDEKRPEFGFGFLKVLMNAKRQGIDLFWPQEHCDRLKPFVKMVDDDGNTLLHMFIYNVAKNLSLFKNKVVGRISQCLVEAGADLNTVKNKAGVTPLDLIKALDQYYKFRWFGVRA